MGLFEKFRKSKAPVQRIVKDPFFSCVTTAFNEGEAARISIESLLAQSYDNFELIIVDDGADIRTRETIHSYQDPRIVHIRQANDGLSSARNRGIGNAKGDYICFLDADDMRPQWALQSLAQTIKQSGPDCVFSAGHLIEQRGQSEPFYDDNVFRAIRKKLGERLHRHNSERDFFDILNLVAFIEPQVANKCVSTDFLKSNNIVFPNGLLFEDSLFHVGILANAQSIAFTEDPTFTYFRRYGRPQITYGTGLTRFDAISVAHITLDFFSKSERFQKNLLRSSVFFAILKLQFWCEDQTSHLYRSQYNHALRHLLTEIDPRYLNDLNDEVFKTMRSVFRDTDRIKEYLERLTSK